MKYLYRLFYPLLWIYWFVRRPHSSGAGVILERGNSLLLLRHTYGHRNLWYFPGGGQKRGESMLVTAQRELSEELHLSLPLEQLGQIIAVEDHLHLTVAYFLGKVSDESIQKDGREVDEVRWWPKSKLPAELSPLTKAALKLYLRKD